MGCIPLYMYPLLRLFEAGSGFYIFSVLIMALFLRKLGVLVLSIVCLATLISFVGLWSLRQSNFYKPSFLANSVEQDQFDYFILGASNGLTTLNKLIYG